MDWSGRNLKSIPKPGRDVDEITTGIISLEGNRFKVYARIQEDAPQDTVRVWTGTQEPREVRWPSPKKEDMREIHHLIMTTGRAAPEQFKTFLKEAMKSMRSEAGEDLFLTPQWKIEKGDEFSPATLFSVSNSDHLWEKDPCSQSLARLMISFRTSGHEQQEYVTKLVQKGKATLEAVNVGNTPALSPESVTAVRPYFAAIDWWVAAMNSNELNKLRFGTVTTLFQSMSAMRDFSFGEILGSVERPIWSYILIPKIKDDLLTICSIPKEAHSAGSLYPYLSSLDLVHKSDMSANAKPNLLNYVNAVGCLLGSKRGQNSTHMPDGDVSFLMNAAFAAYYRYGSLDRLQVGSSRDTEAFLRYAAYSALNQRSPIEAVKILQRDGLEEISQWLTNKAATLGDSRPNSIGMFIHKNAQLPVYRPGTLSTSTTDDPPSPPPRPPPSKRLRTIDSSPQSEGLPMLKRSSQSFFKVIRDVGKPKEQLAGQLSDDDSGSDEDQDQEDDLSEADDTEHQD